MLFSKLFDLKAFYQKERTHTKRLEEGQQQ
jgi:hypothetical protein